MKGEETNVADDPPMRAYVLESIKPDNLPALWPGRWIGDQWPPATTRIDTYALSEDGLTPQTDITGEFTVATPQTVGRDSGEFCVIWLGPEFPGDQQRDDDDSVYFDTAPLAQAIDIVGAAQLQLTFTSDQPVAKVAVRLSDVHEDGAVSRITYALLNLCHADGHDEPRGAETRQKTNRYDTTR